MYLVNTPPPLKKKKKNAESVSSISLGTTVILKRNWQHRYAKFIYLLIIIVIITIIIFLFLGGGRDKQSALWSM